MFMNLKQGFCLNFYLKQFLDLLFNLSLTSSKKIYENNFLVYHPLITKIYFNKYKNNNSLELDSIKIN